MPLTVKDKEANFEMESMIEDTYLRMEDIEDFCDYLLPHPIPVPQKKQFRQKAIRDSP